MSKAYPPELKKFMENKLSSKLTGGRHAQGIVWGLNPFMNLVIEGCVETAAGRPQNSSGEVGGNTRKSYQVRSLAMSIGNACVHQEKPAASHAPLHCTCFTTV
ncbi:unnamed protein product [Gulo gulo]|uniref:Sm domain-containing protein n=1 Tax=Gulo gulo TaxID=48420 RepID=A0A9X9Q0D2_GULGU|nr:unnamed protein product [Gulo gulo]